MTPFGTKKFILARDVSLSDKIIFFIVFKVDCFGYFNGLLTAGNSVYEYF